MARPLMERADSKVLRGAPGDCWVWTGCLSKAGYGQIRAQAPNRELLYAHRVFYEAYVGPIPDGLHIDHLCRVRSCVNPQHLEPVTMLENLQRSPFAEHRKTHCKNGHEFDVANTYITRDGHRLCRACRRDRMRVINARQRAERAG